MEEIKPGFTRVTEPLQVYNKFEKIDPEVLERAAVRGTVIHRYCEMYAKGKYFPEPEKEVALYIESFREWHDILVEEVVFTEERLYDDRLKLTGCVDLIAVLNGDKVPTIIDIKTPQTKSKTWPLQLAAYQYLTKSLNIDCHRRMVLQLQKDGKRAKVVEYTSFEKDWKLYKNALELWRYFQ